MAYFTIIKTVKNKKLKFIVDLLEVTTAEITEIILFGYPVDVGSAVAWWLMPRTPDPEVGGSSPTWVKPCCVLEQGRFTPQKYW